MNVRAGPVAEPIRPLRIVLASNNAGKLRELQALLGSSAVEWVSQGSLGIAEADEPHTTFIENALAKARHAAAASGGPALADDSGLCVAALGGAPGVRSAHFACLADSALPAHADRESRRRAQDDANNSLLLRQLQHLDDRRAAFVCTLVALRHAADPLPLVALGSWHGRVGHSAQGEHGFGYDPLMVFDEIGCSAAQMDPSVKNRLSHRGKALRHMLALLSEHWPGLWPGPSVA